LAWGGRTGISLWDLTSRPPRETAKLPVQGVAAASWSPDGQQVAPVLQGEQRKQTFHVWQPPHAQTTVLNLNSPHNLNFHDQVVGFMDGGRKLAFGGNSGPVVFEIAESSANAQFALSASRASDLMQFAIANRWIACGRRRNSPTHEPPLQAWTATGELAFQTPLPSGAPLRDLAFSPDDSLLAAIGDFGLRVWRSDDWQL
jgi:WD40 repeat protein